MSHVFFFSYAHANKDKELENFFEDLCEEVKVHTNFTARTGSTSAELAFEEP